MYSGSVPQSHIWMFKRGYILGGRGRLYECRIYSGEEGGLDSERDGVHILGGRGRFWEGGIDSF